MKNTLQKFRLIEPVKNYPLGRRLSEVNLGFDHVTKKFSLFIELVYLSHNHKIIHMNK